MTEEEFYQHRPTALDMIEHNKPLQEHWIRRFIAALIDWVIVMVTASIIGFIFAIGLGPFSIGLNALLALFWVFYSAIMEYLYGATIGKMAMDLRVQSLKGPFDLYKAILRNLSKIHGVILLIDVLVGMLTEGDPRQRFLDRIAETTVVGAPHHHQPEAQPQTALDMGQTPQPMQGNLPQPESQNVPLPQPVEHDNQGNP
jgi:uncharacterized RDD family membrane protein YckC